jgi:Ni/Co efflux regulator RcnB
VKKTVARLLLLTLLAVSLPALSFAGNQPYAAPSVKKQQKLQKKQMKKQEKLVKKQQKEQMKAQKKANKQLKKRREQGYAF